MINYSVVQFPQSTTGQKAENQPSVNIINIINTINLFNN